MAPDILNPARQCPKPARMAQGVTRSLAAIASVALLAVAGVRPASARVGDVVALVAADRVHPAPTAGANALAPAGRRLVIADAGLSSAMTALGLDRVVALGPETSAGGPAVRLVLLNSSAGALDPAQARAAARQLVAAREVIAATFDHSLTLAKTTPNDPDVPYQWYIDSNADIHLPEAWDLEHGSSSVVIGILDTGVDLGHPDLASQIWTNPGEIPANGIDDDGNGYIDDVHGWDFGDGDADPNPGPMFDASGIDVGYHGTAVAGVASAATNNNEGIAGAGWNSRILPLKVADSTGATTFSAAAQGILYAAAKHIGVLNMSLGEANPDSADFAFFQALMDQAVAANVACVASAGNEGSSVQVIPAACNGVLAVGSTSENNTSSTFSNWGPWVDVAAPGESMWVPICRNYPIDDTSQIIYEYFFGWDGVRPYMLQDGTSFSSPLAAGTCALVRAHFPTANALGVINHVKATGDNILYDHPIGPLVNAYRAMTTTLAAPGDLLAGEGALRLAPARPTPFTSSTSIAFTLPLAAHVRLVVVDAAGRRVRILAEGEETAGSHAVIWDGRDDSGREAPVGLYFAVLDGAAGRAVTRLVRTAQ
ncbi:MAG: S8 family serine peptidase [Candidatus Eisenbacteria bacterium]